jgi:hypothetical protein
VRFLDCLESVRLENVSTTRVKRFGPSPNRGPEVFGALIAQRDFEGPALVVERGELDCAVAGFGDLDELVGLIADFFQRLAAGGVFSSLAGLLLSSGKRPFAGMVAIGTAAQE